MVEQIEAGQIDTPKTEKMLQEWLEPMNKAGVDAIVLGCTHYPLVSKKILEIMTNNPTLIHSADAIACRVKELLHITPQNPSINNQLYIIPTCDIQKDMIDIALDGSDYEVIKF